KTDSIRWLDLKQLTNPYCIDAIVNVTIYNVCILMEHDEFYNRFKEKGSRGQSSLVLWCEVLIKIIKQCLNVSNLCIMDLSCYPFFGGITDLCQNTVAGEHSKKHVGQQDQY